MSVTLSTLRSLYPEFSSAPDGTLNAWITVATNQVNPDLYGSKTDMAIMALTCHMLAILQPSTTTPMNESSAPMTRTPYGMLFLKLQQDSSVGAAGWMEL